MNRYVTSTVIIILCVAFLSVPLAEELNIAPSAEETNPLKAGDRAADFTVYRIDGSQYHFDADNLQKTTLIITFRGGWCPYCNTQLQELRDVLPDIRQMGVDILFLSGDRPEILYSNLKQETQDFIDGLDYTILSDADMDMGIAYGLAFNLPDDTITRYQSRNYDIGDSSIDRLKALAVPAVYVIRQNGEIAFAYTNPNYRVRLPAADVKAAVERVLAD